MDALKYERICFNLVYDFSQLATETAMASIIRKIILN